MKLVESIRIGFTGMALKISTLAFIVTLFALPCLGIAQTGNNTAMEVKLSDSYYWGEGFSEERQQAIEFARQDFSQRIIVRITSTQNVREEEIDGVYSNEFLSQIEAKSRIELRDLMVKANQRRDGSWEALAYITKEKFEENLQNTADKLRSDLNQALRLEENGRHQRAIALYSEIYLSTLYYPAPIYIDEDVLGSRRQLRSFVRGKIIDWLEAIEVRPVNVRDRSVGNQVEIYIDLQASYLNQPVSDLLISLNRPGYGMHQVRGGETSVYYDRPLEEPHLDLQFRLKPNSRAVADSDLANNLGELLPEYVHTATVDFTDVITFDVAVNRITQNRFRFSPVLENVSVFDIEWLIDGEPVSQVSMFDHTFTSLTAPRQITLRLNRNPRLYVTKEISPQGNVETVSTFRQEFERRRTPETVVVREEIQSRHISDFVSNQHTALLNEIMTKTVVSELTSYMTNLQQRRLLRFGNRTDVTNTTQSYIAIVNPQSNEVVAFLSPEIEDERYNLTSGEILKSNQLQTQFSGYGPVWFQFSRN